MMMLFDSPPSCYICLHEVLPLSVINHTKMSAVEGDGFVKRIALCSAIAAGFGYVGYSVMKSTFCGIQKESEEEGKYKIYTLKQLNIYPRDRF